MNNETLSAELLPVWQCQEYLTCGEQWAAVENSDCPFCHSGPGEETGYSYGDVLDAADRFGFAGQFPVHYAEPVPDLVQLSTLRREQWVGLPVFHPSRQDEERATWLVYDVGVVIDVEHDPDFEGEYRCRFVVSMGASTTTLVYSPDNLWVPKVLADRLVY